MSVHGTERRSNQRPRVAFEPPLVTPTRKAARDRRTELSSNCAFGARRTENWLEVVAAS
jgi:hypothetical protein